MWRARVASGFATVPVAAEALLRIGALYAVILQCRDDHAEGRLMDGEQSAAHWGRTPR
jgi:hypothetical protein